MQKNAIALGAILAAASIMNFLPPTRVVSGQTANPVIITWQANNYFPADYAGRAAVTPGTPVIASVEIIENNKLVDISKSDIRWYVNDEFKSGGSGLKTFSFITKQRGSGYETLRASVGVGDASFQNSVQINIVQPEVVLDAKSSDKTVRARTQLSLSAIPFFFNVDSLNELSFDWQINNERVSSNNNEVSVNVGTPNSQFQKSVPVTVTVKNSGNPYEFGRGFINLFIIK